MNRLDYECKRLVAEYAGCKPALMPFLAIQLRWARPAAIRRWAKAKVDEDADDDNNYTHGIDGLRYAAGSGLVTAFNLLLEISRMNRIRHTWARAHSIMVCVANGKSLTISDSPYEATYLGYTHTWRGIEPRHFLIASKILRGGPFPHGHADSTHARSLTLGLGRDSPSPASCENCFHICQIAAHMPMIRSGIGVCCKMLAISLTVIFTSARRPFIVNHEFHEKSA